MGKWIIVGLAVVGTYLLISAHAPSAWHDGFHVSGHLVSFGILAICGVGFLGYKLKSK